MLNIARQKAYPSQNVRFLLADAYGLDTVPGSFDAGLANFWISHVPRAKLDAFIRGFHERLGEGSLVFMIDNLNTPGHGGEFVSEPNSADTFKLRELSDGSVHKIIKNYFEECELVELLEPHSRNLSIETATYYWWLTYSVRVD
jgi:hypothetical protein